MPDERVRPTSNLNAGWGAGGDYTFVDDAVVQPSAGSGDTATISGDGGGTQQWGCGSPSNSGTISAATLWMRVRFDSNSDGYISSAKVRLNGTWYSVTMSGVGGGEWRWISGTATGSYGALSGSSPAIEVTYTGATVDGSLEVDVAYLDITYTAGGGVQRWAVASGNSNSTATWNGGTLPTADDDVYANNFNVTVNVSTAWKSANTIAGSTAVAGGTFILSNGVTLTLNGGAGNATAGSSTCITYSGTSGNSATLVGNPIGSGTTGSRHGATNTSTGTLNVTGNPVGGSTSSSFGVNNNSTGTLNVVGTPAAGSGSAANGCRNVTSGTLNITGNVTGSAAGMAAYWANGGGTVTGTVTGGSVGSVYGLQNAGTGTVTIIGSVVGGSASLAIGALNSSSGTITVSGNATGGSNATAYGASNTGTGTLTVAGKATSATAPAVNGAVSATLTSVGSAETGSDCIAPLSGKVVFANLATATYGVRNSAGTLGTLTAGGRPQHPLMTQVIG